MLLLCIHVYADGGGLHMLHQAGSMLPSGTCAPIVYQGHLMQKNNHWSEHKTRAIIGGDRGEGNQSI